MVDATKKNVCTKLAVPTGVLLFHLRDVDNCFQDK